MSQDHDDLKNLDRGDELPPRDNPSPLDTAGKGTEDGDKDQKTVETDAKDEEKGKKPPETDAKDEEDKDEEDKDKEDKDKEEGGEDKKRIRIPKSRFDEAMARARAREEALKQQLAKYEQQEASSKQGESVTKLEQKIDELQDKYEDLILDGKKDEARQVRKEIHKLNTQLVDLKAEAKSEMARMAAIDDLKYETLLSQFEQQHPELNPDHPDFAEDKVDEVAVLLEAFMARGFARHVALQKAVRYVMGPAPTAKKGKGDDKAEAEALKQRRAEEARKKAAEADKQQPASTAKVGLDSDKAGKGGDGRIDVMRLSQEQFAKLEEAELARLRGDEI